MAVSSPEKVSDKIICESCGAEFSCGANIGECWCFAVEVNADALAKLKENFQRCLCEKCLKNSALKPEDDKSGRV